MTSKAACTLHAAHQESDASLLLLHQGYARLLLLYSAGLCAVLCAVLCCVMCAVRCTVLCAVLCDVCCAPGCVLYAVLCYRMQ
jgi:hypothetical protein